LIRRGNTRSGGKHAKQRKIAPGLEVESLRLGRYPFAAGIKYYSEHMRGVWREETTRPEREKKLRQFGRIFENLKARGLASTTDPRHMNEQDIRSFVIELRRLDPETQGGQLALLNGFLKFFKNYTLDEMLQDRKITLPKAGAKPIRHIDLDDLVTIFDTVETMEGWTGSICRGMVSLYFGTGVRPSELRLAEYRDLDLKKESLFVRHPKGEGNWASAEWVDIIRQDVVPMVKRYVAERGEYLEEAGVTKAPALFPNVLRESGYYSAQRFRVFKQKIAEASGVDFRLKDFRSTLTTVTVNGDLSRLPAMGMQLRHQNPDTIKKFYADIERSNIGKQLRAGVV